MHREDQQAHRGIQYGGYVTAGGGMIVGMTWVARAFVSDTSTALSIQIVLVVLGAIGLVLDGLSRIRDPSPPKSERERIIVLAKSVLFIGLILGGVWGVPSLD